MTNITAILVIKDNPKHLSEVLSSIHFVSEIIVVNIGINNDCKRILETFPTVKIVKIEEEITYVEQIREKSKTFAANEYVLFLDPDEVISDGLKNILVAQYTSYDYISMPRKNIIFGKWIQHARWWPDTQIRLFKKGSLIWPNKLHAQPEVQGKGYSVEVKEDNAIIHYNYETVTEYLLKMIRYANAEAQELIEMKKIYKVLSFIYVNLKKKKFTLSV